MEARHVLSLMSLASFICYFFSCRCTRSSYLRFILCMLPFIDLQVTTTSYGAFTVFDATTYLAFLFLAKRIRYKESKTANVTVFCLLSLQLLLGCCLSEFISNSSLYVLKLFAIFIYVKLMSDECTEDPSFPEYVVKTLRFICAASVIFLGAQLLLGLDFTFYSHVNLNAEDSYVTRYASFFQDPQMFAQFLAITGFVFLMQGSNGTWTDVAVFVILLGSILLTGGRSALLGMCLGATVVFLGGKRRSLPLIAVLGLAGCLAGLYFRNYFSMFNRMENLTEAYEVRHQIWNEAYTIFKLNPYLGIGAGNYQNYVDAHGLGTYYVVNGEVLNCGTESGYLKILVETGITGSVLVLSIILLPMIHAFRHTELSYDIQSNNFRICLLASLISWLVSFTTLYSFMDIRIFVVVVTMLTLLSTLKGTVIRKVMT